MNGSFGGGPREGNAANPAKFPKPRNFHWLFLGRRRPQIKTTNDEVGRARKTKVPPLLEAAVGSVSDA